MSATNFTPIQLYRTTTAAAVPTAGNLADGELAINLTDEALYFKNAAGVVKLLADSSGALGTVTSVDVSGGTTGLTTSGGPITTSGTITLAGTLAVGNGGTGTATAFTAGSVVFAGASGVYTQDNANLFWDNSNDRLGIGTASPGDKLTVEGTNVGVGISGGTGSAGSPAYTNLNFRGFSSNRTAVIRSFDQSGSFAASGGLEFLVNQNMLADTMASVMRITADLNVGIGVSSPAERLDVAGNAKISSGSSFYWGDATSQITATNGGAMRFLVGNGGEKMRISSAGDVGIGTSSPASKLQIQQTTGTSGFESGFSLTNAVDSNLFIQITGSANADKRALISTSTVTPIAFATNSTERMRIDASGNVGIGAAPVANTRLYVRTAAITDTAYYADNGVNSGFIVKFASSTTSIGNDFASPLVFLTNNADRMRIDGSGNVGIGTSSPSAKLNVVTTGTNSRIAIGDTAAGTYSTMLMYGGSGKFNFQLGVQNNINDAFEITPSTAAGGTTFSTPAFVINSSANVGIGAAPTGYSNAQSSLQVKGFNTSNAGHISAITSAADGWVSLFSGTTAADNPAITWQSGGTLRFATTTNPAVAGFTERMRIDSSGSLLVGTTTGSTSRLIVTGSGSVDMFTFTGGSAGTNYGVFRNQAGTAYGIIGGGGGGALSGGATTDFTIRAENNLLLAIGNTERARIDSSGNLLVGTTAAEGPGKIVSVSTVSGTACVAMRNSAGASSNYAFFINAAATTIIGSITNNADTGVLYNVTSDARAKHDIIDAPEASSLIDAIQVRSFKWNASNNEQRYGFIAQELVEVAPEAVSQPEDPDDMMGVDYSKLVPMLVKELQSLRARVAQLEGN